MIYGGELIFYGGLLICSSYLIYTVVMHISKSGNRNDAIKAAQQKYDNAKKECDNAQQEYDNAKKECDNAKNDHINTWNKLIDLIANVYGQEKAAKINTGTIWMGMPVYLLMVALGNPNDIKESIYKEKTIRKWYYGGYLTRLGTHKYKLEVTLENDEVVGWKDLV